MTEERINLIASASSLHDIGKIAIPDSILLSPRRLTYEEFNIMKAHTVKGCDLLNQLDSVERNEYFTYRYSDVRNADILINNILTTSHFLELLAH